MELLIVLAVVIPLARLAGQCGVKSLQNWPAAVRVGLAVMFCLTASAHFNSMRADLIRMVPAGLPHPEFMVTLTGVCEALGALGLLWSRTRRAAALGLILLLVAVLPANIHAAHAGLTLRGAPVESIVPRIALQLLFMALVGWFGLRRPKPPVVLESDPIERRGGESPLSSRLSPR